MIDDLQNDPYNVFISFDAARIQAAEEAQAKQPAAGEMAGKHVAVKDLFCTRGERITAGSKILENFVPPYESTVTQNLITSGGIPFGKTNMDEFAMGSTTENSFFGPTINPVAKKLGLSDRVPGGSSGGSAAAVAAGYCDYALGSDTGGSIRQPASFCGIVGFKPSYGLCSRFGMVAYASSLDQAGAFAKDVDNCAQLMRVIAGPDEKDSTSWRGAYPEFSTRLAKDGQLKLGIPVNMQKAAQTDATEEVWNRIEELASKIDTQLVSVELPSLDYALPAYYVLALSEASSNLARYDGIRYTHRSEQAQDLQQLYKKSRAEGFGKEVQRRIMSGTFCISSGYYDAYFLRAAKTRALIAQDYKKAFDKVDLLVMPTTPSSAFEIGRKMDDPTQLYLEDIFTVPVNLAGLPAISIPISTCKEGLPLGMQIVGPRFGDDLVFDAAKRSENALKN